VIAVAALAALLAFASPSERPTRLSVSEKFVGSGTYAEGSRWHLRVDHRGLSLVDDYRTRTWSRVVEPGRYLVVSYQRPCDGNCDLLDPPTDRCRATVSVPRGRTLRVTIVNRTTPRCSIRTNAY
jgi:hypothetical protein